MKKAAATLTAGQEIKHRKKWTAIRSVVWNGPNTVITLVTGDVITHPHKQVINYRAPIIDRHNGPVYASRSTTDNRADREHGELMRHK